MKAMWQRAEARNKNNDDSNMENLHMRDKKNG